MSDETSFIGSCRVVGLLLVIIQYCRQYEKRLVKGVCASEIAGARVVQLKSKYCTRYSIEAVDH